MPRSFPNGIGHGQGGQVRAVQPGRRLFQGILFPQYYGARRHDVPCDGVFEKFSRRGKFGPGSEVFVQIIGQQKAIAAGMVGGINGPQQSILQFF